MTTLKKQQAQITRQKLLDAATDLILEKGYAKTSIEGVARAAGTTRGAVYWHFKNKKDLFIALMDQLYQPISEQILSHKIDYSLTPLKQIEVLCGKLLLEVAHDPQKQKVMTVFFLKCDYSDELSDVLEIKHEYKTRGIETFRALFELAQQQGDIDERFDVHLLTISLMALMKGLIMEYLRFPDLIQLEHYSRDLLHPFFLGLSTQYPQNK